MSLLDQLDDDLKGALKSSDKLRLSVLRLMKAAIQNKKIDKRNELTDEEIVSVLSSLLKQRKESIEQFSRGGREDLAQKEKEEFSIIQSYMPKQLSSEELEGLIQKAISDASAQSVADLGKVMKILVPRIKGVADGKWVNKRVRELLDSSP